LRRQRFLCQKKLAGCATGIIDLHGCAMGPLHFYALIRLGFVEEAEAFFEWLQERLSDDAERGPLQVMYGIDGRQKLDELTLDHLNGY
jgi:hypothetical protein